MNRVFAFRTKRWEHGLVVYIYEGGEQVGATQTYNEYDVIAASLMAEEWIELRFGLTDDEYTLVYDIGVPEAQ